MVTYSVVLYVVNSEVGMYRREWREKKKGAMEMEHGERGGEKRREGGNRREWGGRGEGGEREGLKEDDKR